MFPTETAATRVQRPPLFLSRHGSNNGNAIVSGALPLTENEYLKNKVKELLLFVESDGWVVNGFRTLEIVQELKKLCGNDR
ncbi:hypothetical protein UFOVP402_42 [uncultured Caudovirales phage]|uniref:Uncharacterized protein n=1 Tax=uncultured Caudovirales phage TaxID=2100421 RepID=A0A6J5M643_9CAUD|nr:hypothetical protein UFOVP402_42 [uncultured Caudovirales phage]